MTDQERIEAAEIECFKRLCPHTWAMPSGKVFPRELSVTRQAFSEGIAWRDANPSPEVQELVSTLLNIQDELGRNGSSDSDDFHINHTINDALAKWRARNG